ncbi:unnamed protein product [Amoebophrya sp. A120]|nr:unnamed protein product [Amoebophrya sp. A120]|eukprot:GSA120T00016383001.1
MLAGSNAVYLCTATAVLDDHDFEDNKGKSTTAVDADGESEFTDEQPVVEQAFLDEEEKPGGKQEAATSQRRGFRGLASRLAERLTTGGTSSRVNIGAAPPDPAVQEEAWSTWRVTQDPRSSAELRAVAASNGPEADLARTILSERAAAYAGAGANRPRGKEMPSFEYNCSPNKRDTTYHPSAHTRFSFPFLHILQWLWLWLAKQDIILTIINFLARLCAFSTALVLL